MKKFTYSINHSTKQVTFKFTNKEKPNLTFEFSQKRSLFVFFKLLEYYPKRMNIHDLDKDYNDPNKALSVLRINDGFENFIDIEKPNRVIHAKLNLTLLFEKYMGNKKPINLGYIRKSPSQETMELLIKNNGMFCNITKMKLFKTLQNNSFGSRLFKLEWDHRVPLSKGGSDDPNNIDNWQMLSSYINQEKNKICNICTIERCNDCALAFSENKNIILPTNQKINEIIN